MISNHPPHFAIIGAGTAGLATAILLARQNIQVSILEKASELEPVRSRTVTTALWFSCF